MTEASHFAQDHIEGLRASDWDGVQEGVSREAIVGSTGMLFECNWEVHSDSPMMRSVWVTLSWDQDGQTHQINVSTKMAKRE